MIQNEESVLVSRRSVLLGAAGAGLLTLAGPALRADATSAYPGMPTSAQVWNWQHQLVDFGTRYTGSPGHVRFVDWLAQQFAAVPGFQLHTDRLTFNRWLAHDYSLRLTQPSSVGPSGPVPVTYYYPYSGTTSTAGVSGRLVDLGW